MLMFVYLCLIFVCFAEDVLDFSEETSLNVETIISLYFPLLMKEEVVDKETLFKKRENLIKKTKKIASKNMYDTCEKVDLFYNIYNSRTTELPYDANGIHMFSIIMHPDFKHLYLFNGLGAKGYLIAPLLAKEFVDYLIFDKPLDPEVNLVRHLK